VLFCAKFHTHIEGNYGVIYPFGPYLVFLHFIYLIEFFIILFDISYFTSFSFRVYVQVKKNCLSFIGVRCFSFCIFDMIYNASIYKQSPSNKDGHLGDHIVLCSPGAKFGGIF
jgi:hypothetical protein